jgi:hypothetical protein
MMADHEGSSDPHSIGDVLGTLKSLGEAAGDGKVRLADGLEAMGHRAYGPFFILLPLIEMSPVGGIPGLPTAMALVLGLLAVQLVLGRDHMWLPSFVEKRGLKGHKLITVAEKMEPVGRKLDKWFHDRLPVLTKGLMIRFAGIAITLLCLTVPPLELLPFASTGPMLAILAFGIALLVRDGVLMLVACALALGAIGVGTGLFVDQWLGSKS